MVFKTSSGTTFPGGLFPSGATGTAFPYAYGPGVVGTTQSMASLATISWNGPMSPVDKVKEKEDRDKLKRWLKLHRPK